MLSTVLLLTLSASPTDRLLNAMEQVESGGNRYAIGDGGHSYGYYQLQRGYVDDARGRHVSLAEYRRICTTRSLARDTVVAYWRRYEPDALRRCDVSVLARCHNAGPGWRSKLKATNGYVAKVKQEMRKVKWHGKHEVRDDD
jgi:hypothetical protein